MGSARRKGTGNLIVDDSPHLRDGGAHSPRQRYDGPKMSDAIASVVDQRKSIGEQAKLRHRINDGADALAEVLRANTDWDPVANKQYGLVKACVVLGCGRHSLRTSSSHARTTATAPTRGESCGSARIALRMVAFVPAVALVEYRHPSLMMRTGPPMVPYPSRP